MAKARSKISQPRRRDIMAVLLDEIRCLSAKSHAVAVKMDGLRGADEAAWKRLFERESEILTRICRIEDGIRAVRAQSLEGALIQICIVHSQLSAGPWSKGADEAERDACCAALISAARAIEAAVGKSKSIEYLHKHQYLPPECATNTIN